MSEITVLQVVADLTKKMQAPPSAADVAAALNVTDRRARQLIVPLLQTGELVRIGAGCMTRLALPDPGLRARLDAIVKSALDLGFAEQLAQQLRDAMEGRR